MKSTTKKRIFIAVLIIALIAGIYGYKEYTRTYKDLMYTEADYVTNAGDLIKKFEENEAAANKKFLDKIIAVSGIVKSFLKDEKGYYTVVLDYEGMSSVRCSMDTAHRLQEMHLQPGSNVTIKGVCTGFNADELLGSDVVLNRCVIEKK